MLIDQQLLERIDELWGEGELLFRSALHSEDGGWCDIALWNKWHTKTTSFLERMVGVESAYYRHFAEKSTNPEVHRVRAGLGILSALRDDVAGGHFARFREIVHSDLFSDFLEMAEYLLSEDHGYKDPAAVLAGGVLEEHLRLLCAKHGVAAEWQSSKGAQPRKADQMNNDLAAAGVYGKNQQKIITGWLGIRNSAAHGKYGEYSDGQVEQFLAGHRDFIGRVPA
jgi:hypothetical protein